MKEAKKYLTEWIINNVKHKDIFMKNIESIENNKEEFDVFVKYKTKEHGYLVVPQLDDPEKIIEKLHPEKHVSLIILNNEENLKIIVNNWKKFIGFRFFSIYFVNPFSIMEKKWIIFPYTHERIKDDTSFEVGMKSMFESVNPITSEELERNIKKK